MTLGTLVGCSYHQAIWRKCENHRARYRVIRQRKKEPFSSQFQIHTSSYITLDCNSIKTLVVRFGYQLYPEPALLLISTRNTVSRRFRYFKHEQNACCQPIKFEQNSVKTKSKAGSGERVFADIRAAARPRQYLVRLSRIISRARFALPQEVCPLSPG